MPRRTEPVPLFHALVQAEGVVDPSRDDPAAQRLVEQWLAVQASLCLSPVEAAERLDACGGDPARVLAGVTNRRPPSGARLARWRRLLAARGVVVVPRPAPAYPDPLRPLADPPPVLLVRGAVEALHRPAVAVVGARAATAYGLGLARELSAGLARCGLVVVSGLARGIDAAAHAGALDAGGLTVAVQACGPDVVYPPEHRSLADRIAASGAVVTELPPGRAPRAVHFPLRNRLISGLCAGVVVVEARPRSGSLITARHALEQGREVWAVPGPVTAPTSTGPNALIRDGARPVIELRDVVEGLGLDVAVRRPAGAASRETTVDEARLLEVLRAEPCSQDELAARLACSPRELARRLLGLELDGLVVADRDGRLRAVPRDVF